MPLFFYMNINSWIIETLSFLRKKIFSDFFQVFESFFAKIYLILILFLNFLSWISVGYINYKAGDNSLILHYNMDFGVDLLGSATKLFIIPLLGLIFFLINSILLIIFLRFSDFKFLAHLLLASTLLISLFLFASLGPIYLVNFR